MVRTVAKSGLAVRQRLVGRIGMKIEIIGVATAQVATASHSEFVSVSVRYCVQCTLAILWFIFLCALLVDLIFYSGFIAALRRQEASTGFLGVGAWHWHIATAMPHPVATWSETGFWRALHFSTGIFPISKQPEPRGAIKWHVFESFLKWITWYEKNTIIAWKVSSGSQVTHPLWAGSSSNRRRIISE